MGYYSAYAVPTLGGAHVFGGGAEGNWDPNIIDLLATGKAQETMLGSYSVPQGRQAELTAYRFTNPAPIDDHRAPVLAALAPTGVVATNPPEIGAVNLSRATTGRWSWGSCSSGWTAARSLRDRFLDPTKHLR